MCIRKLKNYDKYLQKIELYAQAVNIKIEFKPEASSGVFIPAKRKIRIDTNLSEAEEIAVLLHELGHALDEHLVDKKYYKKMDSAYRACEKGKTTHKQHALVLETEKRAWKWGVAIAKTLKIRLGKWFSYVKAECLKEYKEV